ncbi:nephrin-like [Pecten maximus]|uniref:nephrin-like n=1 Tax=Pecten maximus TaxID=6579 RepID=UPI001457E647|nr:nephrin-like [Pecten maximus]
MTGQNWSSTGIARSRLEFTIDKSYNKQQCVCTATHHGIVFDEEALQFNVIYPPAGSVVLSPPRAYTSITGKIVTLYWQVEEGNPLATLSWQCKGSPRTGQNRTNAGIARSRLQLTIDKSYHRQQCVCTAKHQASPNGVYGTESVQFNVIYPPSGPMWMIPSDRKTVQSNAIETIDCQVKGGNPLATISWRCKGSPEIGKNLIKKDVSSSRLEITIDKSYHQQQCVCTASHQAVSKRVFGQKSVEFNVIYGPFIRLNQSEVVLEGESLTRTCSAYGNPKPTTFWYHDGNALGTKKTLQFLSIDRQDAGNYTCIATATHDNLSLSSSKALNIIVQYGPDVDLSITNATENRTNLRLNCTANGVPTNYTYRWIHKIGSTVIRDSFDHVTNLGSMSTLTIPTVSLQDMGMYICEVENGIPGRNGQIVQTGQGFMSVTGCTFFSDMEHFRLKPIK